MTSRYDGIQNYIMHANESCFFLSLLSIAEEERERLGCVLPWECQVDFLDAVRACRDKGWLAEDFSVMYDCKILEYLTGLKCTKEVTQSPGIVKGNQYTIEKWVCGNGTHFRRRGFDVYSNSRTVREGYRMCYYKYTFKE